MTIFSLLIQLQPLYLPLHNFRTCKEIYRIHNMNVRILINLRGVEEGNSMEIQRKWRKQEAIQGETHAILINIQRKNKNK